MAHDGEKTARGGVVHDLEIQSMRISPKSTVVSPAVKSKGQDGPKQGTKENENGEVGER